MTDKRVWLLSVLCAFVGLAAAVWPQEYTKSERELVGSMLRDADADVQKHYYDPHLQGVDWRALVQEARKNTATAQTMDDAVSEVAALLDGLHDSHTYLILPPRTHVHDYGFQMEMIGDRCFVIRVRSEAMLKRRASSLGTKSSQSMSIPFRGKTSGGLFTSSMYCVHSQGFD
jgi:hypothetical protein